MYWIDFNGHKNTDFGFMIPQRVSIPAPVPRGEYVQVAGRDGSLLVTDGTYENIAINVPMNYVSRADKQGEAFRQAKSWLRGNGRLKFSDDIDVFFKVKAAAVVANQRRIKWGSDMEAEFICDPYTYFNAGLIPITPGNIFNPYDYSKPIYKITGEGLCTLTVNGESVTANVGQNITIDTDLMLSYRTDGTMQNTNVTGDYNKLWLNEGDNAVAISAGFNLQIIPNWRTL